MVGVCTFIFNYRSFLMKISFIHLIIFDNCLICQHVYEQNWLNSSKARESPRLEPKPKSLPENLSIFVKHEVDVKAQLRSLDYRFTI